MQPALPHSTKSLSVYLSSPRRVQPEAAAGVRPALGVARQQEVAEQRPAAPAEAGGRRAAAAVQVQAVARGAQLRHGAAAGRDGGGGPHRLPHLQGLRQDQQHGQYHMQHLQIASYCVNMRPLSRLYPTEFCV